MSLAAEFRVWAIDPKRTNHELFTVEILVAEGWRLWCRKHQVSEPVDQEMRHAQVKERRLNPAYRPRLAPRKLSALVEVWAEVKRFGGLAYDDRKVTDLSALRFFPHLLEIDITSELTDIKMLASLRHLRVLKLADETLGDLGPLAGLEHLGQLHLSLSIPWPELAALAKLPSLRELHYRGNLLAMRVLQALPTVQEVMLNTDFNWKTPLRDLYDLPAMPQVRHLRVEGTASLEGIRRFPACNLQLSGPFRDLLPLAKHPSATWLRLEGEHFMNLAPLARIPKLRELRLERVHPLDLSPLTEAPALREVIMPRCKIVGTELSAVNALLSPWADDFAVNTPRPLIPLEFYVYDWSHRELAGLRQGLELVESRAAFYGQDRAYAGAEYRWFARLLYRRLDAVLGRGWRGRCHSATQEYWSSHPVPGHFAISLERFEDTLRWREVLQVLRGLLAQTRFPWMLLLNIRPHGNLDDDLDDLQARQSDEAQEAQRQREEWEDYRQRQREWLEFLERKHRLALMQEQGLEIDPAVFSPYAASERRAQGQTWSEDGAEDEEDASEGRLAGRRRKHQKVASLGDELSFIVTLTERGLWVTPHMAEAATYLWGAAPVNWHSLAEEPAHRPRPPI